jgi:Na+-transporting NADH:ubiquinone oxidoreductase subunit NqrD
MNNNKISLAVFGIVAALGMLTTSTIQRAMGTNITTTTTTLHLTLGNPYYVEYDKTTSQKQ